MEQPELPVMPDEPEQRVLEENFFYEDDHVETQIQQSHLTRDCLSFQLFFYIVNNSAMIVRRNIT